LFHPGRAASRPIPAGPRRPVLDDPDRTVQAGTLDPHNRYAVMQRFYECGNYVTVDLTELGFAGKYVVMIHPFGA
jgi:hypothetical protein